MAFPVVQTTAESANTSAATSHTVTLPSGVASGDLVVIVSAYASVSLTNALTGWNELVDPNVNNCGASWYRYCDGTEGASITLVTANSVKAAYIAYRISGADSATPTAPTIGTVGTGTSNAPNPGNCNPGVSKDYLAITYFAQAGEALDDDAWLNNAATNYSNPLAKTSGTGGAATSNCEVGSSERNVTASSEDAVWPAGSSNLATAWRAYTILVPPGAAGPTTVNGGVASEADSAPVGKVQQLYIASVVAEADSAPSGKVAQVYTAAPAAEADSAQVGQAKQVYTASPAAEADSAPGGTVQTGSGTTIDGGVAAEADNAPAGQAEQVYTTAAAAEADAAPSGRVTQIYTAAPASEADTAPAGQVLQRYTASPAVEANAVLAGKVLQVYTAAPAVESDSAPAGSIPGSPTTVNGGVAAESDSALSGTVAQVYTAGPASETNTAPSGAVVQFQVVFGGVAIETDAAPAGTATGGVVVIDNDRLLIVYTEVHRIAFRSVGAVQHTEGTLIARQE